MSMLMIRCPRTGQEVWTGIETNPASLQKIPDVLIYTPCPYCGLDHASWCDEAWLAGNLLSSWELGDVRVPGTTAAPHSSQLSKDQISQNWERLRDEAARLLRAVRKARLENQIAATYKRLRNAFNRQSPHYLNRQSPHYLRSSEVIMIRTYVTSALAGAFALGLATAAFAVTGEFDNMCAQGLATGQKINTDCSINAQIDGKTYCFGSEQAKTEFMKDAKASLAKAQATHKQPAG